MDNLKELKMFLEYIINKYSQTLLEARIDYISEKYKNKISPEKVQEYQDIIPDKSHLEWVVKQHIQGNIKDSKSLTDTLQHFIKVKKQLPNKDLNSYRSLEDLHNAISQYTPEEKTSTQIHEIPNDHSLSISIPKSHNAAVELAKLSPGHPEYDSLKKAAWCTSADSYMGKERFDHYNSRGSNLYIINDHSRLSQIHVDHNGDVEGNDEYNKPLSDNQKQFYLDKIKHHGIISSDSDYHSVLKSNKLLTNDNFDEQYLNKGTDDDALIYNHYKRFGKIISSESHPAHNLHKIIETGNRVGRLLSVNPHPISKELSNHILQNPNDKLINHLVKTHILSDGKLRLTPECSKALIDRFKSDTVTQHFLIKDHENSMDDFEGELGDVTNHVFSNNLISKNFIKALYHETPITRIPYSIAQGAMTLGDYTPTIYDTLKKKNPDTLHQKLKYFASGDNESANYFINRYMNDEDISGSKEDKFNKLHNTILLGTEDGNALSGVVSSRCIRGLIDNYPENSTNVNHRALSRLISDNDSASDFTGTPKYMDEYINKIKHDKKASTAVLRNYGNTYLNDDQINTLYRNHSFHEDEDFNGRPINKTSK